MTGIIFVPLLALTMIVATFTWWYVTHVFLIIVEETAAGIDEVRSSDESLSDFLVKGAFGAFFLFVWAAPAYLSARLASHKVRDDWQAYAFALAVGAVFWLAIPLSLLSTMSADSQWTLLDPRLFARLVRRPINVLSYFFLTAVLVAASAPLAVLLGTDHRALTLLGAAIWLGFAFVLYARLTGRLAYVARITRIKRKKKKQIKVKRVRGTKVVDPWAVPEEDYREPSARGGGFVQPSEMPSLQGAMDEEISGYDVTLREPIKAAESRKMASTAAGESGEEGYETSRRVEGQATTPEVKADERELKHLTRHLEKDLAHPWLIGVWSFPFYLDSAVRWAILSGAFLFLGLLIRGLLMTNPWVNQ
jgi:hypothetical protein